MVAAFEAGAFRRPEREVQAAGSAAGGRPLLQQAPVARPGWVSLRPRRDTDWAGVSGMTREADRQAALTRMLKAPGAGA